MDYSASTLKADSVSAATDHGENGGIFARGRIRAESKPADLSVLKESVTFAFSGRTANNRLLKAPMTERLCHWNKEGEDIVCMLSLRYSVGTDGFLVCERCAEQGVFTPL